MCLELLKNKNKIDCVVIGVILLLTRSTTTYTFFISPRITTDCKKVVGLDLDLLGKKKVVGSGLYKLGWLFLTHH